MSRLVMQAESTKPRNGCYFGLSLYETDEGCFQAVVHTRIYDGIRVASKWDSDRIDLAALGKEAAWQEGWDQVKNLVRSIEGTAAP